jgi:hypothetical protein
LRNNPNTFIHLAGRRKRNFFRSLFTLVEGIADDWVDRLLSDWVSVFCKGPVGMKEELERFQRQRFPLARIMFHPLQLMIGKPRIALSIGSIQTRTKILPPLSSRRCADKHFTATTQAGGGVCWPLTTSTDRPEEFNLCPAE